jgi:hypothetical protein
MHEHELHAQRSEQVEIVRQIEEAPVSDQIPAERDDKDLAAESMNVRSDRLEPVDEAILTREPLPTRRLLAGICGIACGLILLPVRNGPLLIRS